MNKKDIFTSELHMNFEVSKSAAQVFEYISKPDLFVSIHPVIYDINEKADGSLHIYERLRFIGVPFSFNYPASISSDKNDLIVSMKAVVFRLISLNLLFEIRESANGTMISEHVYLKGVYPAHPIIKSVFRKQHKALFENIDGMATV
ncbi:MAG: hypothetical protein IPP34_15555 [Bacteroidetes bacterium]|nr:hypothetical protein [Bacteroidota bacterium]MBK7969474.1 hypothetical protein [Bacteroidota bacterium]MBK9048545.1 hypothetical protein [Bacteroidota bacterium]MBK9424077.1 hypothetical protein [Bacteroidota bacterium]MBL0073133.1 hypothetical protein [Bacteroidota bacterium]